MEEITTEIKDFFDICLFEEIKFILMVSTLFWRIWMSYKLVQRMMQHNDKNDEIQQNNLHWWYDISLDFTIVFTVVLCTIFVLTGTFYAQTVCIINAQ